MKRWVLIGWLLLSVPMVFARIPVVGQDVTAKIGGRLAPDGKTEIQLDFPGALEKKNIASRGLGCCVFRSISNAAIWANLPVLYDMPEWMVRKNIAGGGYPDKAAALIKQIAQDRGLAEPDFVQVEGKDLDILKLACATGRMPCVTYAHSPAGRYGNQKIAHMVNLAHCDDAWVAVMDNNYLPNGDRLHDPDNYEWMSPAEFAATYSGMGSGWALILLDCGPPPAPRN
jgi:hypothetical protein